MASRDSLNTVLERTLGRKEARRIRGRVLGRSHLLPNFIIIGAMKCATSTLHDQLALQPGLLMSDPKEPNFFSNDEQYRRGLAWYTGLFAAAEDGVLCGESSTHYTKLPTYLRAVERVHKHVPGARLIYVVRHPVDRLVSHYIHEWTERTVPSPIDRAVRECPRLTEYGLYAMQLRPSCVV